MYKKKINNYEVLTPSGWSNFNGIKKQKSEIIFTIIFDDNSNIKCTPNHLLKFPNGEFLEACHIQKEDILFGNLKVKDISYEEKNYDVYDLLNVDNGNEYYTNNVVSHNCGVGNLYHQLWVKAETKENKFNPIKLKWNVHPERDEVWRQKQEEDLGPKMAAQECFSGDTLIHTIEGLVPIKDITIGDTVLTHLGNYKKVIRKIELISDKVYQYYTSKNNRKRYVTPNHPFYTYHDEWKPIEEIKDGDKICSFIHVKEDERTQHEYTTLYKGDLLDKKLTVYNLEVEDDHSYVTEHAVVHNCLGGESLIEVLNIETNKTEIITLNELYKNCE